MHYSKIKKYDIANGKGIRTSLFCSGCHFHCEGCFNEVAWNFHAGEPFDEKAKAHLFALLADPHCDGLSLLGGEPLMQGEDMLRLVREVRETFPEKTIWLWTGYYLSELDNLQRAIIALCDYVVDGRFELARSKRKYLFRGSGNQTIWENRNGEFVRSPLND